MAEGEAPISDWSTSNSTTSPLNPIAVDSLFASAGRADVATAADALDLNIESISEQDYAAATDAALTDGLE